VSQIREIRDAAIDGGFDLATLLRKCRVLASEIKNKDLAEWAKSELDGYPENAELPDYRVLKRCKSYGQFLGGGYQDGPLSLLRLPEGIRDKYANPKIHQGVQTIVEMVRGQEGGVVRWAWPNYACEVYDHEDNRADLRLTYAWVALPTASVVGVLSTIRNRVLSFALEMEQLNLGSDEETSSEESKRATTAQITQTFHQTITGPVSNVATAGIHFPNNERQPRRSRGFEGSLARDRFTGIGSRRFRKSYQSG
jgi:hypothetical protein